MPGTVCVTGASGFVGSHIVAALLERSHHVIALVRDPASPAALQLASLPRGEGARLDVERGDVLAPAELHAAIARSRYVIHSAAVVADYASGKSREREILAVNVTGSENVLDGVEKAPEVEKVVLTSSMAAVIHYGRRTHRYSEVDWNTLPCGATDPYSHSKTRAERSFQQRFAQSVRLRGKKLVCFNPPVIIGPARSRQHLRTSLQIIDNLDRGASPGVPNLYFSFADVRDVGSVHAAALTDPAIEGRFIMPGRSISMLELARLMRRLVDDSKAPERALPDWKLYWSALRTRRLSLRFLRRHLSVEFLFDDSRLRAHFPGCYRPLETTVLDTVQALRALRERAPA